MALEIKTTPTLLGKSADRFIKIVDENQNKRVSHVKREELSKLAAAILKKAKI
jgi:hypothetical protein